MSGVVSVGRALGSAEAFQILYKFADKLGFCGGARTGAAVLLQFVWVKLSHRDAEVPTFVGCSDREVGVRWRLGEDRDVEPSELICAPRPDLGGPVGIGDQRATDSDEIELVPTEPTAMVGLPLIFLTQPARLSVLPANSGCQ